MPSERTRGSGLLAIAAAAAGVLIAAEVATEILRPRDLLTPLPVDPSEHVDPVVLERAEDYRGGQRLLAIGGLATSVAALGALVAGRPTRITVLLDRAGTRPLIGGALAAGGLYLAVSLVSAPFDAVAHQRSVDVGLSTQNTVGWAADRATAAGVGAVIAGAAGTAALALMRRFGLRWWIPGSAAFVALATVFVWVVPVVIAPIFNDFERLGPGPARTDALTLAGEAGVDVGEVYRVDASRRTTGLNAYVDGIGSTKRIVLYDTLLDDLDRGARRSVIAHELAHAESRDIPRGLLWLAIVAPASLAFVAFATSRLAGRGGGTPGSPGSLPALALVVSVTSLAVGTLGNQLSRDVESRADVAALELTGDPASLIALQARLAERNLSDPDPPALFQALFATHPSVSDRIGVALAWQRGERP